MLRPDVIAIVFLLGAGAALADEAGDCGHPVPDRSIRDCSLIVERIGTTPRQLVDAYISRGAAHLIMGDFDRAITDLDDALRLSSNDPEAFTTRADAYLRKAGISDYLRESDAAYRRNEPYTKTEQDQTRRGYYEQAIADYSRALALNPRHLAAYFGRSLAHRALGDEDRARTDQRAADYPSPARLRRSQSAYAMRQFALVLDPEGYRRVATERFASLDEAIRQKMNDPRPYLERAWAFVNFGQSSRALADYDQAIHLDPSHAEAYRLRGEEFLEQRDYPRALADFDTVVRLEPDNFRGYDLRGLVHERMGERDQALGDYRKALSLEARAGIALEGLKRLTRPESSVAAENLFERCRVHINAGEYDRAIADCDEAIRLDPTRAKSDYRDRADLFERKGEYARAIAAWSMVIQLEPANYGARFNRGAAYFKTGDYDLAITDFSEVLRQNSGHLGAYVSRGETYARTGEFQQAIADYDEAIRRNDGRLAPYYQRGFAHESIGRRQAAIADYRRVLSFDPKVGDGLRMIEVDEVELSKQGLRRLGEIP